MPNLNWNSKMRPKQGAHLVNNIAAYHTWNYICNCNGCFLFVCFIRHFTVKNNSMNCSSLVHGKLHGRRAWKAASDLPDIKLLLFLTGKWILECRRAWPRVIRTSRPVPSCLMMYAAQPSSGWIVLLYVGLRRFFSRQI